MKKVYFRSIFFGQNSALSSFNYSLWLVISSRIIIPTIDKRLLRIL